VARLLGYCWPANGAADLDTFADGNGNGIVCLVPVAGEQPAHERLRGLLAHLSQPPLCLAYLGRTQGRLRRAGQRPRVRRGRAAKAGLHLSRRLDRGAARLQKLALLQAGEPPYDIYVR